MQLELCFGLHMQVVFIAWLLASRAIVEFVLRIVCRRPGYFVSLTMGCVVVTEPFDLTVVGGRHPFNVATRMHTHNGSICEPRRVDTFVICLSPTAFLWEHTARIR